MAQQGAALQTYNNELVRCLEDLCQQRNELQRTINEEEQEKVALEAKARDIRTRLEAVDASLTAKLETRARYDKTISESERAYLKILESSQVLLNVVKKDAKELQQREPETAGEKGGGGSSNSSSS